MKHTSFSTSTAPVVRVAFAALLTSLVSSFLCADELEGDWFTAERWKEQPGWYEPDPGASTLGASAFTAEATTSSLTLPPGVTEKSGATLWSEYLLDPDNHSHLPNNSFAGYMRGEAPVPDAPAVVDVTDFGAVADDGLADDAAFRDAVEAAWLAGGGAITVPSGIFDFDEPVWLFRSGVVLRGAGRDQTFLRFNQPLVTSVLDTDPVGTNDWSWTGGQVWIGPRDDVIMVQLGPKWLAPEIRDADQGYSSSSNPWEYWRQGPVLASVTALSERGDWTVTVDDASELAAGDFVLVTYENNLDQGLLREIGQSTPFDTWDGFGDWFDDSYPRWQWTVEIAAVDGNTVTLRQPLRVATRSEYAVQIRRHGPYVEQVGLEDLGILLFGDPQGEPYDDGWNGVFFNRAYNCWVRNVEVVNGSNGIHVSAAKNVSVLDTKVTSSGWMHHPYTNRCMSHDVLYENFEIDITEDSKGGTHGINTEFFTTGNVWSRGTMNRGTLDTHRGMPFDFVRTEITLRNEKNSNPGGSSKAGPYSGRRGVHWNIAVNGTDRLPAEEGDFVYQPDAHTYGALVGIQGVQLSTRPAWNNTSCGVMPCGDKQVVVGDDGVVPAIVNLFDAMVGERASRQQWVHVVSPFPETVAPYHTLELGASVNGGAEAVVSVEFFVNGLSTGVATAAPWTIPWVPTAGHHEVVAVATGDLGGSWSSLPRVFIGGRRVQIETDDPALTRGGTWRTPIINPAYYGGTGESTSDSNAFLELTFTGTRAQVYSGTRKQDGSTFLVFINSTQDADVTVPRNNGVRRLSYDSDDLGEGTYTLRMQNAGSTSGRMELDSLVFWSTEFNYQTWIDSFDTPSGEQGEDDDPNRNGITNLGDFYMGNSPVDPGGNRPVLQSTAPGEVVVTFPEIEDLPADVIAVPEWSTNLLATWHDTGVTVSRSDPVNGLRTVTATFDPDGADDFFTRVRFVRVP